MNSITREIIERELEHEQGRLSRWEEDIDRQRGGLSRLERERDEIVDRIGALKEDLGRAERADASQRRFNDLIRSFTAAP